MKTGLILLLFLFLGNTVWSQNEQGQWIDYLPYGKVLHIVQTSEKVYGATPYALIEIDKEEMSMERLSLIKGLSGTSVGALAYAEATNSVIVGYQSGSIDIITGNEIQTFTDIKRATQFPERGITTIYTRNDSAFLGTEFGIVLFDLTRKEIVETFMVGENGSEEKVNEIHVFSDTLYAGTNSGIYRAHIKNPNLRLPTAWSKMNNNPLPNDTFNIIHDYNGELIINKSSRLFQNDSILVRGENEWYTPQSLTNDNYHNIKTEGDRLIVVANGDVAFYNSDYEFQSNIFSYDTDQSAQPRDVAIDPLPDVYWIADDRQGVIRNREVWNNDLFRPESPHTNSAWRFSFDNENTYMATGRLGNILQPLFRNEGFSVFNNNTREWTNYNPNSNPELNEFRDYTDIIPDPSKDGRIYVSTYNKGLVEFENGELTNIYNFSNTSLGGSDTTEGNTSITKMNFDDQNNLWFSLNGSNYPLGVKLADDEGFISYEFPGIITDQDRVAEFIITENGYKWVALSGGGIFVFDDNGTPEDLDDDRFRMLSAQEGQGDLPSNTVQALAEDQSGRVWVGTDKGTAVFFSAPNIFDEQVNIDAQQVYIEVDGFTQFLLEDENVTSIKVDGADRKWFATDGSGVFLMSSDGTEEILRFTEDNSPLLSDQIMELGINPNNGEVLMATMEGLTAYKGTATQPDALMQDVYAYPNPVYPHYKGRISIKGLARNARVKITDVNGNLVFDTRAEGGQAVWNGQDQSGNRVPTGVYLVFASDEQGVESTATKILFVN